MSPSLERDYIGLTDAPPPPKVPPGAGEEDAELGMKETELRLGLPGSESTERAKGPPVAAALGLIPAKGAAVAGAKRGFSDAIDGSGKWVFVVAGAGSEAEVGKGGGGAAGNGAKEGGPAADLSPEKKKVQNAAAADLGVAPAAKAQVVGWPPIRSYRKNTMAVSPSKKEDTSEGKQGVGCLYLKVSMDGAPYLRKVDLRTYSNYKELSSALEKMFICFTIGQCGTPGGRDGLSESRLKDLINGSEYVLTYKDRDGDWMLVGDVPWDMFANSCRRLRIMKGSDAIGLAPRVMGKCKSRN